MPKPTRHIIAIGGGLFHDPARRIERYVLKQTRKRRPRVCFFPHAGDNAPAQRLAFYEAFGALNCVLSTVSLFATPPAPDLAEVVLNQDAIIVGGGNTKSMLALWRAWGLDVLLKRAYQNGTVLAGVSAGGNCWFDACVTDSISVALAGMDGCLGFLAGSFCPHYDSEVGRRPTFQRLVASGALAPGIACDDFAAAHFIGDRFARIVAARQSAQGYRVLRRAGAALETVLEPRMALV
jgi:dipeptidase E